MHVKRTNFNSYIFETWPSERNLFLGTVYVHFRCAYTAQMNKLRSDGQVSKL
jgi:hypothetical protein